MFDMLIANHPGQIDKVSLGKTILGNDIWLFRIGNPSGGKVSLDAAIHGWEDIGSVLIYDYAVWLLESGEAEAARILAGNYTLLIPYVNVDSIGRGNANYAQCPLYGVDLNRNFVTGYQTSHPYACGNENSGIYGCTNGDGPASEPETQAMRAFFQQYKPAFHVDHHYGGGPWLGNESGDNATIVSQIKTAIAQWCVTRGVSPFAWSYSTSGGSGMAISDARVAGACAWLWEVMSIGTGTPHADNTLNGVHTWYFPHALPVYIAMSEACMGAVPSVKYTFSQWNDGDTNNPKSVTV